MSNYRYKTHMIHILVCFCMIHMVYPDCGMIDASYLLTPKLISIEYIDGNTETGSEAIFSCPRGYKLIGTSRTQCDGDWYVPQKPKCVEMVCPFPDEIQHGHLHISINNNNENNFTLGSAYSVRCDQGFMVQGHNIRICFENGSWSREPLECTEIKPNCEIPSLIENGTVHLITKTYYRVECDSGFRLNGSSLLECGEDGILSRDIPKCEPIFHVPSFMYLPTCPKLTQTINNGYLKVLGETVNSNPVYHIECDNRFIPDGPPVLICQSDGNWSTGSPYCKPDLRVNLSAVITTTAFLFGIAILAILILLFLKHQTKQKDIIENNEQVERLTGVLENDELNPLPYFDSTRSSGKETAETSTNNGSKQHSASTGSNESGYVGSADSICKVIEEKQADRLAGIFEKEESNQPAIQIDCTSIQQGQAGIETAETSTNSASTRSGESGYGRSADSICKVADDKQAERITVIFAKEEFNLPAIQVRQVNSTSIPQCHAGEETAITSTNTAFKQRNASTESGKSGYGMSVNCICEVTEENSIDNDKNILVSGSDKATELLRLMSNINCP